MQKPSFSLPSILAIIAAVVSLFMGATFGFLLAVAAIVLGIIGVMLAFSPNVRGGVTSFVSIIAGVIGIIAAVFKLAFGLVL